ncbi:MAG: tRNA (adenine(22)-N(1))-methyltransferase TrmK [Bacteriovoracaceae bacterium]
MMNSSNPKLSKRLSCFAQFYTNQSIIWDVGCDHGHLGLSFLNHSASPMIHLVDPSQSVITSLIKKVQDSDIPRTKVFHQKGQDIILQESASHFIFIAGMGGPEIIKILENLLPQMKESDRVLISPHTKVLDVRSFLISKGAWLHQEGVLCEGGIWYPYLLLGHNGEICSLYSKKLFETDEGKEYRLHLLEKLSKHQDLQSQEYLNFLKQL